MKSKNFLLVSIFMYCTSLILPVYISLDQNLVKLIKFENLMGFQALIFGWMTYPNFDFICWLGNFALITSWFLYQKPYSIYLTLIAFILAIFFSVNHYLQLDFLFLSEYHLVLFGYWFWLGSSIVLLLGKFNFDYLKQAK